MIVVDTSALVAVLQREAGFELVSRSLVEAERRLISAGTLTEAKIVAVMRGYLEELNELVDALHVEVVAVDADTADTAAAAYRRWGKGFDRAGLNFGDCFAYCLAKHLDCPLLFVGNDFAATDVVVALPPM